MNPWWRRLVFMAWLVALLEWLRRHWRELVAVAAAA